MLDVIAVVVDRGDVEGLPPGHLGEGLVVDVGRMLDRVGPGPDGVARPGRAVGVDGDPFAEVVGGVDGGLHLLEREGLIARDILVAAGRAVHLDDVDSRGDLLADDAQDLGDAVGLAAGGYRYPGRSGRLGDVQAVTRDEHPRPGHRAPIDQVAHGDVGVLGRAQVANRGDARPRGSCGRSPGRGRR